MLTPSIEWNTVRPYRKRWFVFLTVLLFVPATLLIIWSGGVYFRHRGGVYGMPRAHKLMLTLLVAATFVLNLNRHA